MRILQTLALLLLGILVIIFCAFSNVSLSGIQSGFLELIAPISHSGHLLKNSIGSLSKDLMTLKQLQLAYDHISAENRRLHAENNALRNLKIENDHLREQLGYCARSSFHLMPAGVLSHDASLWWSKIKINRGSKNGISANMAVITESGLVGKTIEVSNDLSEVLLITDENCKVAVNIEGSKERGISMGKRNAVDELLLTYLSKSANLHLGQKVYTSGVNGGIFPSGIALGTVKSFHLRELDAEAILEPSVDLGALEEVFVVIGDP